MDEQQRPPIQHAVVELHAGRLRLGVDVQLRRSGPAHHRGCDLRQAEWCGPGGTIGAAVVRGEFAGCRPGAPDLGGAGVQWRGGDHRVQLSAFRGWRPHVVDRRLGFQSVDSVGCVARAHAGSGVSLPHQGSKLRRLGNLDRGRRRQGESDTTFGAPRVAGDSTVNRTGTARLDDARVGRRVRHQRLRISALGGRWADVVDSEHSVQPVGSFSGAQWPDAGSDLPFQGEGPQRRRVGGDQSARVGSDGRGGRPHR